MIVSATHRYVQPKLLPSPIGFLLFLSRPRNHRAVAVRKLVVASGWCDRNFKLILISLLPLVAPESSTTKAVVSPLKGSDFIVRCTVFAYPVNVNYWLKDGDMKGNSQIELGRHKVLNDP